MDWLSEPLYAQEAVGAAIAVLLLGFLLGRIGRGSLITDVERLRARNARMENQAKEQTRIVAQLRGEQSALATMGMSLPYIVRELNSRDLDPRRVPTLILDLVESIFRPSQMLFYRTETSPGPDAAPFLLLACQRGLNEVPAGLQQIAFGEGKIGWVAQHPLDMMRENWNNLSRTEGIDVPDNDRSLCTDIVGPMVHHDAEGDRVLGVLCIGGAANRPRDEKLMFQLVTNLGSLAMVGAQKVNTLAQAANTDGLTGLLNKRFFLKELGETLVKCERKAQPLALFIFDIDHFKTYNDTNGHQAGDQLLRELADVLRRNAREGDYVCRYGGEEFVLAMPGTSGNEAMAVAEGIRTVIERHVFQFQERQPSGNLTISGGVAVAPEDADSVSKLTECADTALYESKRGGRNRVSRHRAISIGDPHGTGVDASIDLPSGGGFNGR